MKNKTCGIYLITERETGKMYVGLAKRRDGIEGRWAEHKNRFPKALFTYEILLPCPPETTREELSNLEKFYIKELDCMEPNGFNKTSGGCGKTEVSEETRKRVSAAKKGIPMSEEHKAKLSAFQKNRVMSEEERAKRSAAIKVNCQSEEARAKRSAANRCRVMSEEERAKRSEAMKGKNKGKTHSAESRARQSEAQKGRVQSEEERAKRSEAMKAVAALKRAAKAAAVAALEALLTPEIASE